MANSDDAALWGEKLRKDARAACSRARTLATYYRELTRTVAATEERVAETMDRMAARRPERARQCRAYSQQARKQAALWRQRAGPVG